jgi:sigma-E factor negative regulatory protein RseC
MSNKIKHSGTIESINGDCLQVRILQSSACAGCKVANHCSASDAQEKKIDIYGEDTSKYAVGDAVTLSADTGIGYLASLYAYVIPLILMVGTLVVVLALTDNEVASAVAALLVLVPYWLGIALFKNKIRSQVYFKIEKTE